MARRLTRSCEHAYFFSGLAALLTPQAALANQLGTVLVGGDDESKLYLVRTICIGKIEGLASLNRDHRFRSELNTELAKKGFTVTKNVESADALLTGVIEIVIVLDGDGTNIPDDTLRFQLTSPSSNDRIWSAKLQTRGQSTAEKDDRYKAERLAAKIWRDWSESLKKAAKKSRSGATSQ